MPNKHFYVAIGAAHGALAAALLHRYQHRLAARWRWFRRLCRRNPDWFLYFPAIYLPFVVWAVMPDLLHGLAILPKEVTRGPLFDIFYLHSSFERWEDSYLVLDRVLNAIGSVTLLTLGLGNLIFYVRAYRRCTGPAPSGAGARPGD